MNIPYYLVKNVVNFIDLRNIPKVLLLSKRWNEAVDEKIKDKMRSHRIFHQKVSNTPNFPKKHRDKMFEFLFETEEDLPEIIGSLVFLCQSSKIILGD
jgi:hypothetical protein